MAQDVFSPRELELIEYLLMGLSNKEIGTTLFICEKTCKGHITNILRKSGCKSRTDFVVKALKGQLPESLFPWNSRIHDKYVIP
jgi:DNA-binding NarL/FixJ family response regulator